MMASPVLAAEVTPERLLNPDKEPQNWLMNHRTYDGQRFSPLARINRDNVKNLKLAYAVPLGGAAGDEWVEATPLVENGFIYITDSWGVLYKIDATSGEAGRIVWRMEPKQEKQTNNRGAALCGNLVISPANWPAATAACATGLRGSMRQPERCCGANSRFRRPANPAAKPGRAPTMRGRPAARRCGSPGRMIPTPTRPSGAPAIRCRCSIRLTGRAIISTPTARFPGIPRPAT